MSVHPIPRQPVPNTAGAAPGRQADVRLNRGSGFRSRGSWGQPLLLSGYVPLKFAPFLYIKCGTARPGPGSFRPGACISIGMRPSRSQSYPPGRRKGPHRSAALFLPVPAGGFVSFAQHERDPATKWGGRAGSPRKSFLKKRKKGLVILPGCAIIVPEAPRGGAAIFLECKGAYRT